MFGSRKIKDLENKVQDLSNKLEVSKKQIELLSGVVLPFPLRIHYVKYDYKGRIVFEKGSDRISVETKYDDSGEVVEKKYFDDKNRLYEKKTYLRDSRCNVIEIYVWRDSYENILHKFTNTYNSSGLAILSIKSSILTESKESYGNGEMTIRYEYSNDNRVVLEVTDDKYKRTWKYDSKGNLILFKIFINEYLSECSMMFYDSENRMIMSIDEESGRRKNGKPRISIIEYKEI